MTEDGAYLLAVFVLTVVVTTGIVVLGTLARNAALWLRREWRKHRANAKR